jgi:hypothetical protein
MGTMCLVKAQQRFRYSLLKGGGAEDSILEVVVASVTVTFGQPFMLIIFSICYRMVATFTLCSSPFSVPKTKYLTPSTL